MFIKVFLGFCMIAVALANPIHDHHPHHEEHHQPQPYHFGYDIKDHEGSQHRQEQGDGHGNVKGSYGYVDNKGIHREVHYVADHNGFRAQIKTNEPGTANQDPADVKVDSHVTYQHYEPQPKYHHEPQHHVIHHQPHHPYY